MFEPSWSLNIEIFFVVREFNFRTQVGPGVELQDNRAFRAPNALFKLIWSLKIEAYLEIGFWCIDPADRLSPVNNLSQ